MAHSLSLPFPASQPESEFSHVFSGTKFIAKTAPALSQTVARDGLSAEYPIAYVIGSGSHAFAYIVRIGDYLFQSPISYYSRRGIWDVAPGYETNSLPDYDRPVTPECLTCHAGHASPVAGTLNRYESPAFSAAAISCDRCHGDPSPHLEHPSRENIINPARLPERARDSVCEQCHLSGEVRILNPKRQFSDFRPGEELEDVFSVYVRRVADSSSPAGSIKVISQAEQLAMSVCARRSAGKLWCGTCHNPHEKPENVAQYYRARCLSCHGERLVKTHAKPDDDCVSCHMPKRQARDGAHTAFTDHRITRIPVPDNAKSDSFQPASKLAPWHEPAGNLALRNLGLANIEMGERDKSADHLDEGARELVAAMKMFPDDPVILTKLGLVFLRKNMVSDATELYEYVVRLDTGNAGYHINLALAYKEGGKDDAAIAQLEKAIELDPGLETAYRSLGDIYLRAHNIAELRRTFERYLKVMPNNLAARAALRELATH